MNLNPGKVVLSGKERRPKRFLGIKIFAGFLAAVLIGVTIYVEGVKKTYGKEVDKVKDNYLRLSQNISLIENLKEKRANFFKNHFLLDFPLKYSFAAANFARRLSLIASPGLRLLDLDIQPKGQTFTFLLKARVRVKGGEKTDMQPKFLVFFQELESFADMVHVSYTAEGFDFTIEGEVELE